MIVGIVILIVICLSIFRIKRWNRLDDLRFRAEESKLKCEEVRLEAETLRARELRQRIDLGELHLHEARETRRTMEMQAAAAEERARLAEERASKAEARIAAASQGNAASQGEGLQDHPPG